MTRVQVLESSLTALEEVGSRRSRGRLLPYPGGEEGERVRDALTGQGQGNHRREDTYTYGAWASDRRWREQDVMRERKDSRTPPTCLSGQSTWKTQPLSELIRAEEGRDSQGPAQRRSPDVVNTLLLPCVVWRGTPDLQAAQADGSVPGPLTQRRPIQSLLWS